MRNIKNENMSGPLNSLFFFLIKSIYTQLERDWVSLFLLWVTSNIERLLICVVCPNSICFCGTSKKN